MGEQGERLVQLCSCNACRGPLGESVFGSPRVEGAFCSQMCADHAGGERRLAEIDHEESDR
jgi:hypothetical protein